MPPLQPATRIWPPPSPPPSHLELLLHAAGLDIPPFAGAQHMLLHSAAYDRYLAATNAPTLPGHRWRRVDVQEEEAIRWQVIGANSGNDSLLRNVTDRYLHANGRYICNGVSVDDFEQLQHEDALGCDATGILVLQKLLHRATVVEAL